MRMQRRVPIGSYVVTPDGKEGKLRGIRPYHDGHQGRPFLVAKVQLRAKNGRLLKRSEEYWYSDLHAH